jgi:hypothetical protein
MNPFNLLSHILTLSVSIFVAWLLLTRILEPKVGRTNFIDTSKMTRYPLLLDEKAKAAVERLTATYGLNTKADVYDLGIRLLTLITNSRADGYEIGKRNDTIVQHLILPEFNRDIWKASEVAA